MKEKIIKILGKIGRPKDLNDINSETFWLEDAADEILKMAEFEVLCNPDIYEMSANEHFENESKKWSREATLKWLLTHAGVESEYNRNLIYNTLYDK